MDPTQNDQSKAQKSGSATTQGGAIGSDALFAIPGLATGDAVYDSIMGEIEPELTSSQIQGLAEKYKNETPEDAEARKIRYNAAYTEYEKRFNVFLTQKEGEATSRKRRAMASIEQEDRQGEEGQMSNLESSISAP